MEILALIGSPRKGANTDTPADALLDAARQNGGFVKKIYLCDHQIGPCVDCRACKAGALRCPLPDELRSITVSIDAADVIVFATPVYWFSPTGPMKTLLDRMRPYCASRTLAGKRAILLAPAGDGPKEADLLDQAFRRSCEALGMAWTGSVFATGSDRGDILQDVVALQTASRLGESL